MLLDDKLTNLIIDTNKNTADTNANLVILNNKVETFIKQFEDHVEEDKKISTTVEKTVLSINKLYWVFGGIIAFIETAAHAADILKILGN